MDRHWLLTWTMYGTWLPGDRRGFVGRSRDHTGRRVWHHTPNTPPLAASEPLRRAARERMRGPAVLFDHARANVALSDVRSTVDVHGWALLAAAIMRNHVHLVVGVPRDPDPATLLHAFKGHCDHTLTAEFGRPTGGRWWTQSGSRRHLPNEGAVVAAVRYVMMRQYRPLVLWNAPDLDSAWLEDSPPA